MDPLNIWKFALVPYEISKFEIWRLFTAPFFHTTTIHLIINLLFIFQVCPYIEKHIGSFWLWMHIFLFCFISGILYSIFVIILSVTNSFHLYYVPLLGFTSIELGLSILISQLSHRNEISFLGFFDISPKFLPFLMFVFFLILLNNASFLGPFCGIISGYLHFLLSEKKLIHLWTENSPKFTRKKPEFQTNDETIKPFFNNPIDIFEYQSA